MKSLYRYLQPSNSQYELFELLDKATKSDMEFLICDNQDGAVFFVAKKKSNRKTNTKNV